MKKRILFYSDCPFFAGCENMLANLFNDDGFMEKYDVSFVYRYSAVYESGFRKRVKGTFRVLPIKLLDLDGVYSAVPRDRYLLHMSMAGFSHLVLKHVYILSNTIMLTLLFRRESVHLLHINNGGYPGAYSCAAAVIAARLAGIRRIVYVVNNIARPYWPPWRWLDLFYDRIVFASVAYFVTGSAYARKMLEKVLYINPEKTLNIFNGVEPRTVTETREETLRRLKVDARALLIGVVAVLEHRKGHTVLIDAIA